MAYKINTIFTATYDNLKSTINGVKTQFKSVEMAAQSAKNTVSNAFNTANKDISNVNKEIKKSSELINSGLKASAIGIASITVPTFIAGKSALTMAGQYEAATQTLEYTLGEAKSIVDDFVQNNAQAIGMAEQDAYKFANIYSNLLTAMTYDQKTNAEYTSKLMQASAVIMSKTGRTFTDVADRIRSGLLGNTEAIEDLGVQVQVNLLESTEAFKKIADGRSWDKLSFKEQQQIRLLGILEQTTAKYGEQVGDNLSLKLSQTTAKFQNLKTESSKFFATGLQPIIAEINSAISGILVFVKWLNTLNDSTKQTITTFVVMVAIIPVVALVFLTLIKAINSYVIFTKVASASTVMFTKTMMGLLSSVLLIVAGITMLAYAFGAFNNNSKSIKKTTSGIGSADKSLQNLTNTQNANAESAKNASKANKELADNLQSFDEINKLNLDSKSNTDSIGPTVDLSGIDTSAFDNIDNQFSDLNQSVENFKNKMEDLKPIIGIVGGILGAIGIGKLITGIGKIGTGLKGLLPTISASSRAGSALVINWGLIGSAASTVGSILAGVVAPIAATVWGVNELNKSIYEVKGATDIFKGLGNQISNSTKESVEPFINKIKDLNYTISSIDLISGIVTDKDVAVVKEKTSTIANELKEGLVNKTQEIYEQLNNTELFPDVTKREKYLGILNTSLANEQNMINYYEGEINRIIETASIENRELKQEEKEKINNLTKQMGETGISILSENEQEKLLLQAKFNEKYDNMTKEQVVNAVAKAKELKDKSIQEAQEEYDEKVKLAETMKATVPGFTEEMYNEMLEDAKTSKDNQIKEANETYDGIVNKVKEQYPEVSKTIDFENGEALNSIEAFGVVASEKFKELKDDIKEKINLAIQTIKDEFNELKDKFEPIKDWWNEKIAPWFTWEKWKNLGQNAVNGITSAFSNMNISFKMPHFTWTTTPATGWVSDILSALSLPTSLPKLNVDWYEGGGVFGSKSIIGVGEYAGARSNPEIVAPQSMIYDANIEAIKDSKANGVVANNGSDSIMKKIEVELNLKSGGVRLGKQIVDLVLDANDFYELGLI